MRTAQVAAAVALFGPAAHAQSPQPTTLPVVIGESQSATSMQGLSTGISFEFDAPSSTPSAAQNKAPIVYGVTENMNLLSPAQSAANGLTLTGAALFASPTSGDNQLFQKQAISQTLGYNDKHVNVSFGYLNVGSLFNADTSQASSPSTDVEKQLNGEKGQTGLNGSFSLNQNGNSFGLKMTSLTDTLQGQHRLSEVMSMQRNFNSALSMNFERDMNTTQQMAQGTEQEQTSNVLHLAYSPTRSGFLLDAKSTQSFTDQGDQSNDMSLKVAQHFSALNLTSQFESYNDNNDGTNTSWFSSRYDATASLVHGLTFSGYWARKTVADGTDSDSFDGMLQTAETRYVQLAAEYARIRATDGTDQGKETLAAKITPGSVGPLGPLLLALSINNQQTALLGGYQSASANLSGEIVPFHGIDLGMSGAKYYLAYTEASEGGTYETNGEKTTHVARTLRLVSAPAGKNGLNWTVSEQQRLDQNGQPLETASDCETKYILNRHVSVGLSSIAQMEQPNGNFTDQNQQSASINWNQTQNYTMIAQYVHSRYPSQNIAQGDGYFVSYVGPAFSAQNVNIGLGEQVKRDFNGQPAYGTTGKLAYDWKADDQNQVNISSNLTDWQNRGFNADYDTSYEADGTINFQRLF